MEISWEQTLTAAGDCDSDSCSSWESVAASEDERGDEWAVVSDVGSVQSIDSSNHSDDERDVRISYKDVLLRSKVWALHNVVTPVIKSRRPAPWINTELLVLPVIPKVRVDTKSADKNNRSMFDAESIRDGVKQCRGGRQERMFKGNEKLARKNDPSWYSERYYGLSPEREKKEHRRRHRKGKRALKARCGTDSVVV